MDENCIGKGCGIRRLVGFRENLRWSTTSTRFQKFIFKKFISSKQMISIIETVRSTSFNDCSSRNNINDNSGGCKVCNFIIENSVKVCIERFNPLLSIIASENIKKLVEGNTSGKQNVKAFIYIECFFAQGSSNSWHLSCEKLPHRKVITRMIRWGK